MIKIYMMFNHKIIFMKYDTNKLIFRNTCYVSGTVLGSWNATTITTKTNVLAHGELIFR